MSLWTIVKIRFWNELALIFIEVGSIYCRIGEWCGKQSDNLLTVNTGNKSGLH